VNYIDFFQLQAIWRRRLAAW